LIHLTDGTAMNYITGKVFIDTNILVYLLSDTEPDKRKNIQSLLGQIEGENPIVWSTQIIQEFYQVMTSKYGKEPQKIKAIIKQFTTFETVINGIDTINNAIDIQVLNNLSFWDSLVISAAVQSSCSTLLTEDLNHGQNIGGVMIHNPFAE